MGRLFGFAVGLIWVGFAYMAFSASSDGRTAGQPDVAFWWSVITVLYGIAATVALVGTARHRITGPSK